MQRPFAEDREHERTQTPDVTCGDRYLRPLNRSSSADFFVLLVDRVEVFDLVSDFAVVFVASDFAEPCVADAFVSVFATDAVFEPAFVASLSSARVTRDLLNQSEMGSMAPAGSQYTGKHVMALLSAEDGMVPCTREHCGVA